MEGSAADTHVCIDEGDTLRWIREMMDVMTAMDSADRKGWIEANVGNPEEREVLQNLVELDCGNIVIDDDIRSSEDGNAQ